MYAIDELVFRVNEGICRIIEIGQPDFQNARERRLYYTLIPLNDEKTKIYVPTEPESTGIRRLISPEEARKLIEQIPHIEPITVENEKLREQQYRQLFRSNDPGQLAAVIKTLYAREQARISQGKKPTTMDSGYFQKAEKLLYSELAMVLGVEESSIPRLIEQTIKEKGEA